MPSRPSKKQKKVESQTNLILLLEMDRVKHAEYGKGFVTRIGVHTEVLLNQSSRKFTVDFDGEISPNYVRQQLEDKEIELSCGAASFAEGDMVWHKERHLGQVIELNWKSEQAVEDDPTGEGRKKENAIDPRKPIVILFGEGALKNYTNAERLEMRGQVVCCGSYIRKDRACPAWSFATLCAASLHVLRVACGTACSSRMWLGSCDILSLKTVSLCTAAVALICLRRRKP